MTPSGYERARTRSHFFYTTTRRGRVPLLQSLCATASVQPESGVRTQDFFLTLFAPFIFLLACGVLFLISVQSPSTAVCNKQYTVYHTLEYHTTHLATKYLASATNRSVHSRRLRGCLLASRDGLGYRSSITNRRSKQQPMAVA